VSSANSLLLVNALESQAVVDGRYTGLKCVNINSLTGQQRGCFSLVFSAFDKVDQRQVALKFFDLDASNIFAQYRFDAFQREHTILQSLLGVRRCLQVASSFSTYKLHLTNPNGTVFEMPCPYFAVEWLDEDVDKYFQQQDTIDTVEKLCLYHDIVLATEALHSKQVYHRDIKMDNLRATYERLARLIVAIDLGTAARLESPNLQSDYDHGSVGAPFYAPAEARCGFAGERKIARFTDMYALGCMLFELFNRSYFYRELVSLNPNYQAVLMVMSIAARSGRTPADRLQAWQNALRTHGHGVTPVSILSSGHSVPPSISTLLDDLVRAMTRFDYRQRPVSLEYVRRRIQSAITVLRNERVSRDRIKAAKARRAARIARLAAKEQRLAEAMAKRIPHAK
jgi:serine/threonine protein kinase